MLASSEVGQEQQHNYLQKAKNCSATANYSEEENVSIFSLFIDPRITAKKKSSGGVATSPPRLHKALTSSGSRGAAKSHAVCPLQRELRSGQVIKSTPFNLHLRLSLHKDKVIATTNATLADFYICAPRLGLVVKWPIPRLVLSQLRRSARSPRPMTSRWKVCTMQVWRP